MASPKLEGIEELNAEDGVELVAKWLADSCRVENVVALLKPPRWLCSGKVDCGRKEKD